MKAFHFSFPTLVFIMVSCVEVSTEEGVLSRKTRDDTELFFKNLRQSEYELTEMKEAGLNIFKHKEAGDRTFVTLNHHWRDDLASLMVNLPEGFDGKLLITNRDSSWTLDFFGQNIQEHIELSLGIYRALEAGGSISINDGNNESANLFEDENSRKAYETTIKDYLMLTGNSN